MRVGPAPPFLLPFGQQYLHNRVQHVHIDDVGPPDCPDPAQGI
jgi:hypothetical protein